MIANLTAKFHPFFF